MPLLIRHRGNSPKIHSSAYVAPNAVVSGDVTIGPRAAVLFGAVVTADGGPVVVGAESVIMENAVIRGTPRHATTLGEGVLVGPGAHLTGCTVESGAFLATGAAVFNGARVGRGSSVRIRAVVHVNSVLPPDSVVPIGWVAVGDPAQLFPASDHERIWPIQKALDFPRTVWGTDRSAGPEANTRRYARALARHASDVVLGDPGARGAE